MKASIRTKIMAALFLIAFLTFVSMLCLTNFALRRVSRISIQFTSTSEAQESAYGRTEIIKQTLKNLERSASDLAYITELQLNAVAYAVNNTVDDLQSNMLNMLLADKNTAIPNSSQPKNTEFASVYLFTSAARPSVRYSRKIREQLNKYTYFLHELKKASPWISYTCFHHKNGIIQVYPWVKLPSHLSMLEPSVVDTVFWYGPQKSLINEKYLSLIYKKTFYNYKNELCGFAAVEVPLNKITKHIAKAYTSKKYFPVLLGPEKQTIIWTGDTTEEENIFDRNMIRTKIENKESGICQWEYNKTRFLAAYARIPSCGWTLVIIQPESIALREINAITKQHQQNLRYTANQFLNYISDLLPLFILLACVLLFIVLLIGYFLAKQLTRPLQVLAKKAGHIGAGHLSSLIHIHSGDEVEHLADSLNRMATDLKHYIKNLNQAAKERQKAESDLKAAAEIQKNFLPVPLPDHLDFELYAYMKPAREVGGDLYDFIMLDDKRLFFAVGDVSGKGISAALFMASAQTLMHGYACSGMSPSEILVHTNNSLAEKNDSCMFITAFCGIYDASTNLLIYANAGHNHPLHLLPGKEPEYLDMPAGFPLGPLPCADYAYEENTIVMTPGEALFIYTDGATEALNDKLELFGSGRLKEAVQENAEAPAKECVEKTVEKIFEYMQKSPQSDDLTILMLRKKKVNFYEPVQ